MTVLRFPVTVRLDVLADEDLDVQLERVASALDVALERAARHPRAQATLATAGGPGSDCRTHAVVRIGGDPMPTAFTARLRHDLHGVAIARSAQLVARARHEARRPSPLPESQSEPTTMPFDPRRLVADRGRPGTLSYLVPSYGDHGAPVAATMHGTPAVPAPPPDPPTHVELREVEGFEHLQALLLERFGGQPPPELLAVYARRGSPHAALVSIDSSGRLQPYVEFPLEVLAGRTGVGATRWRGWNLTDADQLSFLAQARDAEEQRAIREGLVVDFLHEMVPAATNTELVTQARSMLAEAGGTLVGNATFYWLSSHGTRLKVLEITGGPSHDLPVAVFSLRVAGEHSGDADGSGQSGPVDEVPLPLDQLGLFFTPDPAVPFLGEPAVEDWPLSVASRLRRLIGEAGSRIGIEPGRFAGMFVLAALVELSRAAAGLGEIEGSGVEGESPRMTIIHNLIEGLRAVEELQQFYTRVVAGADHGRNLPPPLRHNSASWLLHFLEELSPRRDAAVADLFVASCQDQLLDVLESSRRELLRRQSHLAAYLRVTRVLILLMLVDDVELSELREILVSQDNRQVVGLLGAGDPEAAWWASAQATVAALQPVATAADGPAVRGRVRRGDSGPEVQDSTGRWWRRSDLESVISTGRQQAFAVDPMLEKLADLDDTVERLRLAGPDGLDAEFARLIADLLSENADKTGDVRGDRDIAFGLASFQESDITDEHSIGAQLSGIHERAHEVLRPLFTGVLEDVYTQGMRSLVSSELGKESLFSFLNIVGLTALAILCPPAAFAVSAVEAISALDTAYENRGIQRAMLGGEDIISKAQAEAQLWGAWIGAALTFAPEVPGLLRGAARGAGAVVRGEVREAATVAGQQLVRRATEHIAELAAENLARSFATECLKAELFNLAIGAAIGRFEQAVAHEAEVGNPSVFGIGQLLGDAISGPGDPS